ncbi:MAG TPA: hypothetical protein VFE05_02435, partial [Longimicrobiaceae bacterium]|nr:hypothetical protein [Longimicrobiaceae bacterium]
SRTSFPIGWRSSGEWRAGDQPTMERCSSTGSFHRWIEQTCIFRLGGIVSDARRPAWCGGRTGEGGSSTINRMGPLTFRFTGASVQA